MKSYLEKLVKTKDEETLLSLDTFLVVSGHFESTGRLMNLNGTLLGDNKTNLEQYENRFYHCLMILGVSVEKYESTPFMDLIKMVDDSIYGFDKFSEVYQNDIKPETIPNDFHMN